ncbi:glycosyltransferase, partial [Streptomyces sp. NPDC096095]|uniref:glycosyltransferase n=1 Tax=Streptomyces sp. NPDC096095 TaxID=3155545 RepID=UPI00332DFE43
MSEASRPGPLRGRRLLVVSTNYAPELTGIGPYATQLAEHWAASGARVRAITGMPHYPAWQLAEGYRNSWRTVEIRGGVGVHRRRHYVPPRQTALRRAAFEASVLATGLLAPPPGRPDVVISQMPSLAGGVIGARLARRHGVPYLPVVQDLMGAAAAQSGIRGVAEGGGLGFLAAGYKTADGMYNEIKQL